MDANLCCNRPLTIWQLVELVILTLDDLHREALAGDEVMVQWHGLHLLYLPTARISTAVGFVSVVHIDYSLICRDLLL